MRSKKMLYFLLFIISVFVVNSALPQFVRTGRDTYVIPNLPRVPSPTSDLYQVIKQDFWLTLRDGVKLDASKFYPAVSNPFLPDGYPCVIMVHGYGDSKETLEQFANNQAAYGYVVYTYSVRGQGHSEGLSNLISTVEAQDLIEFVNFVRTDFTTGLDTSKILIMGGSQGGTLPYIAACLGGLNVKTIISALSSPVFASSWIENGSIKMTFLWTIEYTSDTARYTPLVDRMSDWVYSSAPDKWDSLARWVPYQRDFSNIVQNCNIPMLIENSWQDKFFNAAGNLNAINQRTAFARYYFGAVMGHGGDISPTEDQWHMNFFNEWFYYYLFGIDNGILTRPRFHFASTTFPEYNNMWSFLHDSSSTWQPSNISNLKLYFNKNNALTTTPNSNSGNYVSLANKVAKGFTMQEAVNLEFTGPVFDSKFSKEQLVFETTPLTNDLQLLGTPSINLDYYSTATPCQFNFQIYEIKGSQAKLVTRINYTDRKYKSKQRKTATFNGMSHGHIFKAGNKIRVVVTNLDTAPDDIPFLSTNPHVLPVLTNGTHRIYLSSNSYLNFPVRNYSGPLYLTESDKDNKDEMRYALRQNYPNPFNPTTTIAFSVPKNEFVTLKVYDVAGKEVAVLVNEYKTSGNYEVQFSTASLNLSSGIYFYKLQTGSFTDVKKMVLVK